MNICMVASSHPFNGILRLERRLFTILCRRVRASAPCTGCQHIQCLCSNKYGWNFVKTDCGLGNYGRCSENSDIYVQQGLYLNRNSNNLVQASALTASLRIQTPLVSQLPTLALPIHPPFKGSRFHTVSKYTHSHPDLFTFTVIPATNVTVWLN